MSTDSDKEKHKTEHHKVHRTSHSIWSSPIRAPSNSYETYFGKESGGSPNWDKLNPHACILVPIHLANVHIFFKGINAMQNLSPGDHTMTLVLCRLSKFGEVMMLWSKKNIQDVISKTYFKVCYKLPSKCQELCHDHPYKEKDKTEHHKVHRISKLLCGIWGLNFSSWSRFVNEGQTAEKTATVKYIHCGTYKWRNTATLSHYITV